MELTTRLGAAWSALTKGITREQYLAASSTAQDRARGNYRTATNHDILQIVGKAQGYANTLITMRAAHAADVPVRVYRRVETGRLASRSRKYQTRAISRKARRHMESGNAGRKVAEFEGMGGEVEEITQGPLVDFIVNPNRDATAGQHARLMYTDQQQAGQAFDVLVGKTPPEGSYRMDPVHVTPKINDEGEVEAFNYGRDRANVLEIPREDVLWYRHEINPRDPYDGWSPVRDLIEPLEILAASLAYELTFIRDGTRPDMHIQVPGISPEKRNALLQTLRMKFRGVSKSAEPLITDTDIAITPLGWAPKDLLTQETREQMYRDIRNALQVPESMADLNDANLASAKVGYDRQYAAGIRQMVNAQAEQMTKLVPPLFGFEPGSVIICADDPMPDAVVEQTARLTALQASGVMTINESRAEIGLDDIGPDGDTFRVNGQSLESLDREPLPMLGGFGLPSPATSPEVDTRPDFPVRSVRTPEPDSWAAKALAEIPDRWTPTCKHATKDADLPVILNASEEQILALANQLEGFFSEFALDFINDSSIPLQQRRDRLAAILEPEISRIMAESAAERAGVSDIDPDAIEDLDDLERSDLFTTTNARALERAKVEALRLAGEVTESTAEQLTNAIRRGVAEGRTIPEIANDVQEAGFSRNRSRMIARTETARAYSQGQIEGLRALGVERKEWTLAPGPCPICEAIAARVNAEGVGLDDDFFGGGKLTGADGRTYNVWKIDAPPAHPNCFHPDTPVMPGSVVAATRSVYDGPIVEIRTESGRVLTVTENHPVLTPHGFVAAGSLGVGDDLVECAGAEWPIADAPNHHGKPPSIREVVESLAGTVGVATIRMPSAPEQFHGDGAAIEGDVSVIRPDGLLSRDAVPGIFQQSPHLRLDAAGLDVSALSGDGALDKLLVRASNAPDGIVGGRGESGTLGGGGLGHAGVHGLAAVPDLAAGGLDPACDNSAGAAVLCGERLDAGPVRMLAGKVVAIDRKNYSGHVYDLQTVSGALVAGGIVAHNCRCTLEGVGL